MQEIFWIITGLEGFLFTNKRPDLNSSFVINAFYDIECNFVSKKKSKVLHTLALRFFLSTCYLKILMNGHVLHYSCLKKAQSNIFCVPKFGLTVLTAFSGKFQLKFCLFFVVLFSRFKK